jgi:hypothetical protein
VDLLRAGAIPALAIAAAIALDARADCAAINGTYADESVEKFDGSPRTLSSFAPSKDRSKLFHQEKATGPAPTFGGSGQVMQRPKTTKLVATVELVYESELTFHFRDASGKELLKSQSTTPRRWRCVAGRLERKFQMATGLGEVMRTEEVQQAIMAGPGGDLTLVESRKVIEGPKTPGESREAHFKRVKG